MRARRGLSLIEMLVVVTGGSVLLGISVTTAVLLGRADRTSQEHTRWALAIDRLAAQFREDVHAATLLHATAKAEWRLALDAGRTVTYRLTPESLDREETVAGRTLRRESYAIPDACTTQITLATERTPAVVSLTVAPRQTTSPVYREMCIDAVLGRDGRFAPRVGRTP